MTQKHLTCGTLSNSSRETANVLSDSRRLAIVVRACSLLRILPSCGVDEVVLVAQRDEDLEATGLVLQLAQPQHVVDPVTGLLDVPVQHGRRGLEALLVRQPVDARPVLPVGGVVDDVLADLPVEDLRAAAGERLQPGVDQLVEDLAGGAARRCFSNQWISVAVKALRLTPGSAAFSSRSTRG